MHGSCNGSTWSRNQVLCMDTCLKLCRNGHRRKLITKERKTMSKILMSCIIESTYIALDCLYLCCSDTEKSCASSGCRTKIVSHVASQGEYWQHYVFSNVEIWNVQYSYLKQDAILLIYHSTDWTEVPCTLRFSA